MSLKTTVQNWKTEECDKIADEIWNEIWSDGLSGSTASLKLHDGLGMNIV